VQFIGSIAACARNGTWYVASTLVTALVMNATVINAVPAHQTGVASGINNAVASLAALLAVAIFGELALGSYDRALDRQLAATSDSPQLTEALRAARGKFATAPVEATAPAADRLTAQMIIRSTLALSITDIMLLAAALALGAAATGALLPRLVGGQAGVQQSVRVSGGE
jgi:hypothetical protein